MKLTPEFKSGIIALIIGIVGYLYIYLANLGDLFSYLGMAVSTPFLIYGIGILLNPSTKRKEMGKIPFRGW
ncbi:energy-converting hydrogenase A subunit I [Methanococcus voltae]|uniref:Energy-converting hydrogenase A subunit I n=2 Tax=Methanococcus voltae TaxID=2188 RepID=A0A8J7S1M5_METVO|nr:hypothetical protein [Methanococcus voltae]MBP2143761.1 energy-converting hydrogenase A subunit I [Methanococcus voltae]MBP2172865.1 energy-converting hydrogenase A subunit I [Methanococcus voltae]MBP2201725.1 energy-converting hydrogenase A subunit I [Methanococcus voltae]MCS3922513.1 energy-converting hydrogenase A subunit I [Methanococcus voltae PS]